MMIISKIQSIVKSEWMKRNGKGKEKQCQRLHPVNYNLWASDYERWKDVNEKNEHQETEIKIQLLSRIKDVYILCCGNMFLFMLPRVKHNLRILSAWVIEYFLRKYFDVIMPKPKIYNWRPISKRIEPKLIRLSQYLEPQYSITWNT